MCACVCEQASEVLATREVEGNGVGAYHTGRATLNTSIPPYLSFSLFS